jgi:uncharacterized protein YutE (UPF0331/DUF86 family)
MEKEYFWRYTDIENRMNEIHRKYKELVDTFFADYLERHPYYFPFYNGINYSYVDLEGSIFKGIVYIHSSCAKMQANKIELKPDEILKRTNRNANEVERYVLENYNLSKSICTFQMLSVGDLASFNSDDAMALNWFNDHAKKVTNDANKPIIESENLLFKYSSDLPASLRKYTTLLEKVDDEDFKAHIKEAYECFMSEKKLATSLLLGRALELMCRLILNMENKNLIKEIPSYNRSLGKLIDKLESNNIIDEQLMHSVKSAAEHRNSVMHSIKITEYNSIIQTLFDEIVKLSNVYSLQDKS